MDAKIMEMIGLYMMMVNFFKYFCYSFSLKCNNRLVFSLI